MSTSAPTPPRPASRSRASLIRELAKFGSVGAAAYVVDVGLYNLLVYGPGEVLGHKPVTAKVISVAVSILVAWVGNRYWTFSDKRNAAAGRELVSFIVVNVGGLAIGAGCLYLSRYALGLHSQLADNIAGNVIGTGLGTIFRYLAYKYFVFRGDQGPDGGPGTQAPAGGPVHLDTATSADAARRSGDVRGDTPSGDTSGNGLPPTSNIADATAS